MKIFTVFCLLALSISLANGFTAFWAEFEDGRDFVAYYHNLDEDLEQLETYIHMNYYLGSLEAATVV